MSDISTAAPDPDEPPPGQPDYRDMTPEEFARAHFGYLAGFLDHPEIGPIVKKAATEEWTPERMAAQLSATDWYKTTQESDRKWQALKISDPAEAQAQLNQRLASINDAASRLHGFGLTSTRALAIAEDSLRYGWDDTQLVDVLAYEKDYDPTVRIGGEFGATSDTIRTLARRNMISVSDQTVFDYARRVAAGELTEDGIASEFRARSAAKYTSIADLINAGTDAWSYFSDTREMIAQHIGEPADSIDLTSGKWAQTTNFAPPGGGIPRPMTLEEVRVLARKDDRFGNSRAGREEAAEITRSLLTGLGKARF